LSGAVSVDNELEADSR